MAFAVAGRFSSALEPVKTSSSASFTSTLPGTSYSNQHHVAESCWICRSGNFHRWFCRWCMLCTADIHVIYATFKVFVCWWLLMNFDHGSDIAKICEAQHLILQQFHTLIIDCRLIKIGSSNAWATRSPPSMWIMLDFGSGWRTHISQQKCSFAMFAVQDPSSDMTLFWNDNGRSEALLLEWAWIGDSDLSMV